MFTNSKLAKSVKLACAFGAASTIGFTGAVNAQETEEAMEAVEKISVTGSRIRRADLESASPVTVINREDLVLTGLTDVGDFIQSLPSMSGSPIGTTTNNGGDGSVQINLRGLGAVRTLTLVNGKRVVDGGDYQAIPATMIERVEILKDGSSAVYGADAVAGVVNIITRKDFEGVDVTLQTADWFDTNGGGQDQLSIVFGKTFDKGNFVFGMERVDQDEVFQADTPWDFMQNSYYIYPAGCEAQVAAPYDGTPQGGCYPVGSSRIPESRLPFYSQGTFLIGTPASAENQAGLMIPHDGRTYNYAPVNYLQTPFERTNIFAEANYEISDKVQFSAEFRGNQRTSAQQLAPLPFTGGDPMYNGFYDDPATGNTVAFTGISQDNYYLRQAVDNYNQANGLTGADALIYEPVVNPRRRMIETNRRFEQDITQYQWNAQLNGELDNGMYWEVFVGEGHRSNSSQDFGQFAGSRLFNALGPSADLDGDGVPECYADVNNPGTLIQGCVPLNLFGGGQVDEAGVPVVTTLTQDMLDYVSLDTVDSIVQKQRLAGANISGYGFDLQGGELGWSVGWSYWRQSLNNILDSAKTIGAVTGNVGASTSGSLVNNSVFGEVYAPFFDNGEQKLSATLGVRYDDWDAFDSGTTFQVGLEGTVVENLKLRSTYGTVFRAPTISDLFGGVVDSFPTYVDPCIPPEGQALPAGCAQVGVQLDTQVNAKVGGNPDIQPEEGDTFTVGVVYSPSIGEHDFTFIADYWSVELEDGITSLGVNRILSDCYVNELEAACGLITRNPDYSINNIVDTQLNLATFTAEGVDVEMRWTHENELGLWNAGIIYTNLMERSEQQTADSDVVDFAGLFVGSSFPEHKANIQLRWAKDDWSVAILGEYIGEQESDVSPFAAFLPEGYRQKIDAELYTDVTVNYSYESVRITAGITNVTDEAPPFIDGGFNGSTDPSTYRMFGRGYFLRLNWNY
jgi:outer membrane receptor protein involved in Fe transport